MARLIGHHHVVRIPNQKTYVTVTQANLSDCVFSPLIEQGPLLVSFSHV